jgi:hypothetical protein
VYLARSFFLSFSLSLFLSFLKSLFLEFFLSLSFSSSLILFFSLSQILKFSNSLFLFLFLKFSNSQILSFSFCAFIYFPTFIWKREAWKKKKVGNEKRIVFVIEPDKQNQLLKNEKIISWEEEVGNMKER